VFSGIATPESFEKFVRDLGGNIVFARRFLDHYRFAYDDFVSIFSEALEKKIEYIVTTEKDAVRIQEDMPCPVPIYYLRLEIEILHGAADFDEAVGRICFSETGATHPPMQASSGDAR
jgi:tetraacyldisaccharide 4'-kinase